MAENEKAGDKQSINDLIQIAVITLSDRAAKKVYSDQSGPAVKAGLLRYFQVEQTVCNLEVIPDEALQLKLTLQNYINKEYALIITTGGTGIGPRDITPDVTQQLLDKEINGIAEAIRSFSMQFTPHAMLSRGVAGMTGKTLIVNLPGSPKAINEIIDFLSPVLTHAMSMQQGLDNHVDARDKSL